MRTQITVTDLNLRQWDHLVTQVPVDGRTFLPGIPVLCVGFKLNPDISELHIQMDAAEFLTLMLRLENIRNEVIAVAHAALVETTGENPTVTGR